LNVIIAHLLDFLSKILPEHIDLEFAPDPALKSVTADAIQIEQVVMNLCINARDAMPNGGKILIKTQNVLLDERGAGAYAGVQPGLYVLLTIADTGVGMDEQVRERMFEPFFTTKEPGTGTGLGLSMVHGIIAQHNGFLAVDSEMGKGTTFNIYFPAVDSVAVQAETEEVHAIQGGKETILVVEDDPDVRELMEAVLREYGYTVIMANDGEEGLTLFEQHAASIALVIADLMMPKMKGRELYEQIRRLSPTVRFLFVSGYRANQLGQDFVLEKGVEFLEKPFDLDKLAATIRKVLV
jgi:CheY-like chemotaxis protein